MAPQEQVLEPDVAWDADVIFANLSFEFQNELDRGERVDKNTE